MADAAGEANVIVDSAYSMWQGIYPATGENNVTLANGTTITSPLSGQQYLPIETLEFAQSPLLEAFTTCPTYLTYLNNFYNSTTFAAKALAEKPFLSTLPDIVGNRSTSLLNAYNIYDFINVNSIYNATFLNSLGNTTLEQASDAANWLSYYSFTGPTNSSAGNIAGRGMMGEILTSLQTLANTTTGSKIQHYSISYKPFLSVFNMTGSVTANPELAGLVSYASLLAFELRESDNEMYVNMVFRNGSTPGTTVQPYTLLGQDQVLYGDFLSAFNSSALFTMLDWCKACNQTTSINNCNALLSEANTTAAALASKISSGAAATVTVTHDKSHFSAVGAGFIGALVGIAVATIGFAYLLRSQRRRNGVGKVSISTPVQMDAYGTDSSTRGSDTKNPFKQSTSSS